MKLTKGNVYIDLKGKSKEELNLITEITGVENLKHYYYLHFYTPLSKWFRFHDWAGNIENKTEVTIPQLKEILKPMRTFTPIAMRCTQEQFDAIKPKLKGLRVENISSFNDCKYLINNLGEQKKLISNVMPNSKGRYNRETHEKWNEEIFLKACGIEVETFQDLNNKNMVDLMGYSVLVDNKEQARKLQETAFEQGFKWVDGGKSLKLLGEESFQFGYNGKKIITYNYGGNHYQDKFITKTAHFNDLFKEETLQEKEQRLLKELEEVRKEIEDSKIKVGDWAVVKSLGMVYKRLSDVSAHKNEVKLTNSELIKLLEQEMN